MRHRSRFFGGGRWNVLERKTFKPTHSSTTVDVLYLLLIDADALKIHCQCNIGLSIIIYPWFSLQKGHGQIGV